MRTAAKYCALLALGATLVPPVLFAFALMSEIPMKTVMLSATLLWFAAAPFWLKGGES